MILVMAMKAAITIKMELQVTLVKTTDYYDDDYYYCSYSFSPSTPTPTMTPATPYCCY